MADAKAAPVEAEAVAAALTFMVPLLVKFSGSGSTVCQAPVAKALALAQVTPVADACAPTLSVPLLTMLAEPDAALTRWPMPKAIATAVPAPPLATAVALAIA